MNYNLWGLIVHNLVWKCPKNKKTGEVETKMGTVGAEAGSLMRLVLDAFSLPTNKI